MLGRVGIQLAILSSEADLEPITSTAESLMKNIVFTVLGVTVVAILSVLIFVYSGVYDVAATKENSAAKVWLLQTTLNRSVASRAAKITVPSLDKADLLEGASHYDAMCASCHGAPGKSRAEFAAYLNPEPPDFGKEAQGLDHPSAQKVFWITKYGIEMTGMPAWGPTHSDEELWDMVAFMQKFSTMSGQDYQGWIDKAQQSGHHHDDHGHDHGEAGGHH